MIEANEYALRRNKLFNLLDDNSVTIIFSGVPKIKSADECYPFTVNKNFFYLTGIEQENSILMMVKSEGQKECFLFIDEKDEKIEKWIGYKMTVKEARSISNVENVFLRTTFEGKMLAFFSTNDANKEPISKFYLDLDPEVKISDAKSTVNYKKELEVVHKIEVDNVSPLIGKLRLIKSEAEIAMIREAISTTELGLKNALLELNSSKYEYNMRNIFEHTVFDDEDSDLAFSSIVAGGENGVILHYPTQKSKLRDGDLVLFDVGAAKSHYCADISRTYPVSGKFTEQQKVIYNIVLNCNIQTAKFMRPGLSLKEINAFAKKFLADECLEKGLISSLEEIDRVYYHSVGHFLGLDTHDFGERDLLLQPGNVVTCEPGLYFKELGIGIRIEDDVLITENGSEVLSSQIIKTVEEIEKVLGSR